MDVLENRSTALCEESAYYRYNKSSQCECYESRDGESTLRLTLNKMKEFENQPVSLAAIASSSTCPALVRRLRWILPIAHPTTSEKRPGSYFSIGGTERSPGGSPRIAIRHLRASNAAIRSRCLRSFSNFRIWVSTAPGVLPSSIPTAAWRRIASAATDSPFGAAVPYSLSKRASRSGAITLPWPRLGRRKTRAKESPRLPFRLSGQ